MKKVMRPRYYCDYCGKSGGASGHIKKHELHCTLNPSRKCRMCSTVLGQEQPVLNTLLDILPTKDEQKRVETTDDGRHCWDTYRQISAEIVENLRKAAGACPACMMAALRQRGLPVGTADGFNYKEESQGHLRDYNESQYENG